MKPLSDRRAALLASLLTLVRSLASPVFAFGGALCVSRTHLAVEASAHPDAPVALEPGCHGVALDAHGPCTDVELATTPETIRAASGLTAAAPPFADAPALASLAPPPVVPSRGAPFVHDLASAPCAPTHLDLRILRI